MDNNITLTNTDTRRLVQYAQTAPEYLSFYKACFAVAHLTGQAMDDVISICKQDHVTDALIEEANRVPRYAINVPQNGIDIIF